MYELPVYVYLWRGKRELGIEQRCNSIILYYSPIFWFLVINNQQVCALAMVGQPLASQFTLLTTPKSSEVGCTNLTLTTPDLRETSARL